MKYKTIVVDPPWQLQMAGQYKRRNERPRTLPYQTLPLEKIKAMPISELAEEGAHLWLWVTTGKLKCGKPVLSAGFELMAAWGFTYLQMITWKKPSGYGNYFLSLTEHILFGYKDRCEFNRMRYVKNAYDWGRAKAGHHSRKPLESYGLIESISDAPRLEIFARPLHPLFERFEGWDVFGDEIKSNVEIKI